MCGICGRVQFDGHPVERRLVADMCATLLHRGPDGEGIYTAPHIGLGQRRLSIIDLSPEATGPLSNEDGSLWVTFNGEIYNFRELRTELVERGHSFRTRTDTEVLVHLYEEYGTECLDRLRGMFAFGLWDARSQRLFAARDRLGKKPLYYARTPTAFVFGSEIKAITVDPDVRIAPNYRAIDDYLTFQYVPSPFTAFDGIYLLPPAHYLVCDARGALKTQRYWDIPLTPQRKATSAADLAEELLQRLREAVRARLVADVPLGAFLSGGIDSSMVVALMAELSERPVKTFSIGFDDEAYNELPYARQVAQRFGTEHHEFVVSPDLVDVLPKLVWHYNQPFADSSALPTYYVSKLSRQHVTVALSGDGGDENFAGYDNYARVAAWERADVVPAPVRRTLGTALSGVLDQLPYTNTTARIGWLLAMFGASLPQRYVLQSSILKPQEKHACYTPRFWDLVYARPEAAGPTVFPWRADVDPLGWMMRHDQRYYLPDCLMVKTDIASMANSLEVRCPLLDHTFIEFTATIPSALKRNASGGKVIFKRAAQHLLPPEVLTRRKTGFGVPLAKWFRGELIDLLHGTLLDDRALRRNLFEPRFLSRMVEEQTTGRRDWSNRLWALLILELWLREFID